MKRLSILAIALALLATSVLSAALAENPELIEADQYKYQLNKQYSSEPAPFYLFKLFLVLVFNPYTPLIHGETYYDEVSYLYSCIFRTNMNNL